MFIFQHFLRFQNKSFCFPTFQNCSDSGTLLCFFNVLMPSYFNFCKIFCKTVILFRTCISLLTSKCSISILSLFLCWKVGVSGVGGMFVSKICYLRLENILYRPTNAIILQILMLIYFWISYVKIPNQVLRFRFLFFRVKYSK